MCRASSSTLCSDPPQQASPQRRMDAVTVGTAEGPKGGLTFALGESRYRVSIRGDSVTCLL